MQLYDSFIRPMMFIFHKYTPRQVAGVMKCVSMLGHTENKKSLEKVFKERQECGGEGFLGLR